MSDDIRFYLDLFGDDDWIPATYLPEDGTIDDYVDILIGDLENID